MEIDMRNAVFTFGYGRYPFKNYVINFGKPEADVLYINFLFLMIRTRLWMDLKRSL